MKTKQALEICIQSCQNNARDIQNLATSLQNRQAKDDLNKAMQSINDCIYECQIALRRIH